MKLYNLDRTIDINCNAQKTPVLLIGEESERLALENLYKEYDGNMPVIKGYKNMINADSLKVLKTDAPYVADKLDVLKQGIWNEALTFLGVVNSATEKRERMIESEITSNMGHVVANRITRLRMREQACKKINNMFGLNISVRYRNLMLPELEERIESVDE